MVGLRKLPGRPIAVVVEAADAIEELLNIYREYLGLFPNVTISIS